MAFGDYLAEKRKDRKMTIRFFAKEIGISPSFLCDLESNNRAFPSNSKVCPNLLNNIINCLKLNEEEATKLKSLADESMLRGDKIAQEISDYLKRVPEASLALRKANEKNVSKEKWDQIMKILEESK